MSRIGIGPLVLPERSAGPVTRIGRKRVSVASRGSAGVVVKPFVVSHRLQLLPMRSAIALAIFWRRLPEIGSTQLIAVGALEFDAVKQGSPTSQISTARGQPSTIAS